MAKAGPTPRRRTVIRYTDAQGNRCKADTPSAVRHVTKTNTYYAKIGGRWVSLQTTDLGTAWVTLRRRLRDGDPQTALRKLPLEDHLAAFAAHLDARGGTPGHRQQVLHDLRWLAAAAGWRKLADLDAESLERALTRLRAEGRSAQTRKLYRQHANQFARWCMPRRLPVNPLAGVPVPNVAADRRLIHRCPTGEELAKLFAYLASPTCPLRCCVKGTRDGLSGPARAMGYKVCLGTGFRANELRALRREWFDLAAGTVTLPARYGKNRQPILQPLPAWLVAQLRDWFAAGGGTWERFPPSDPGQVLSADLTAAGVQVVLPGPDAPEAFTFHSFRVHYISALCSDPANDLKTIMTLARHSDPKLTLTIYAKFRTESARGALDRLPPPGTAR